MQRHDPRSWWAMLWRPLAPLVDVGLALALTLAVTLAITVGYGQGRPTGVAAYALAPVLGVLALARRRWSLAVLLASAAALFVYNQFDNPGQFSLLPLSVALATAWAAGHRGCIQVTERAYRRLRGRYRFQRRAPVQVKGKGELVTWSLLGRAAPSEPTGMGMASAPATTGTTEGTTRASSRLGCSAVS